MNLPTPITSPAYLGRFAREVREALVALQRRIPGPVQVRPSAAVPDHPFRVVPEGDEHVTLRGGQIRFWDIEEVNGEDSDIKFPIYGRGLAVADITEIEVTGEGKIWLTIPVNTRQITEQAQTGDALDVATFTFIPVGSGNPPSASFNAADPESGDIHVDIADVDIADGVAFVVSQNVRENITLSIQRAYGFS